jgi:hypothetical protein
VEAYPDGMSRTELSEAAEVTKGGTFSTYVNALFRNGLAVEERGVVRASDTLFMAGALA